MKEIKVNTLKQYSIYITSGSSGFNNLIEKSKIKNVYIITDENVYKLYSNYFKNIKIDIVGMSIIKPGEDSKNIDTICSIYNDMIKCSCSKKTVVIAMGGGVVGDIGGFVASTFMRGVEFIQVPTTLMAQCDSSIGGKNGFDFHGIKNIIGTFYQPHFVYADVNFIKTLIDFDYKNGLSEVIKYGFVLNNNLLKYIEENRRGIKEREIDRVSHIVYECLKIKAAVVQEDEFDTGKRNILNFGHTIGHALESELNFTIPHGEAVAYGMILETRIALKSGIIDDKSYQKLLNLLRYFEFPTYMDKVNIKNVISFMLRDKKNTGDGIKFVLPDELGHAIITSEINQNMIIDTLNEWIGRRL